MPRKSKFLTFLLSFIPGLGQIYLGFSARGGIFFSAVVGVGVLAAFMNNFLNMYNSEILLVLIPVIWFAAMIDSMILADKINYFRYNQATDNNTENKNSRYYGYHSTEEIEKQNKKIMCLVLSIVPGASHLYLGLQKQGISLMASFFLCFFISDWIGFGLFLIFIPIIWFYSLFDVYHKISGNRGMTDDDIFSIANAFKPNSALPNIHKIAGFGLIIIGILAVLNRVVYPNILQYLNYDIKSDVQTVLVSLILIVIGIRMIVINKKKVKLEN